MVGRQEQIRGNFCFYDFLLSKRTPTFLNRNFTRALEIHRQELQSPVQPSKTSTFSRAHWRYLSSKELQKMSQHEEAKAFVLEIQGIEPLKLDKSSWGRPARRKLPLFRLDVDIQITIVEHSTGFECKKLPSAQVTMIGTHSENGKKVSLAMSRSTVKLEDLLRVPQSRRKEEPKDWDLLISIYLQDNNDAKEFFEHVASPDSPLLTDPPTRLRTTWRNILDCPEGVKVHPLSTSRNSSSTDGQLDFGLATRMFWTSTKASSILAGHNQQLNDSSSQAFQYPTPPPQPLASNGMDYELTFVYADNEIKRHGLKCPYDPCSKRNFAQLDDLYMHLETWHDLFKHTLKREQVADGVEHWVFECEVAEHRADQQRASNTAPDPRDITLIAPKRPFNQKKYLSEGNDDFQKTARREGKGKIGTRVPPAPRAAIPPRQPGEVQDRTLPRRRTYRVPKAPPNVTFFRSISKRPLQEGEYISESDDEVEMSWVQQKKDAQMAADPSIPEASKNFLRVFDPYMREERLQDDYHVGDALIRFVRAKATLLWEDKTVSEFKVKVTKLLEDNIISKDIHIACIAIVDEHTPAARPEGGQIRAPLSAALDRLNGSPRPGRHKRIDKGKGRAKMSETGQITPQTADSDGDVEMRDSAAAESVQSAGTPPFDQCLCGDYAALSRGRALVACESVVSLACSGEGNTQIAYMRVQLCDRHVFHVDCVMKVWKPAQPPDPKDTEWICNDCLLL